MDINYVGNPTKDFDTLIKRYEDTVLVISEIFELKTTYCIVLQELLDILKYKFEDPSIRKKIMKIKFNKKSKKVIDIELRHLVSNLIFWKPILNIDRPDLLDESYIFDFKDFSSSKLLEYIDTKIIPISDDDFHSKNGLIDDIYHGINAIAHGFGMLIGNGISIHNIMTLEEKYPEVHKIMYTDIDENLTPKEIEDELNDRTRRLIDIISNDTSIDGEFNDFKALYASGAGIKPAQLKEFMIKIGLKADLHGNIIPIINNGSFLVDGLPKPSLMFINALSGRKALIAVKQGMGIPGAYAKKLCQISTSSGILADDNEMCDSIVTVDYIIRDDKFLSLLDGRYYYDDYGKLQYLDYNRDKHLIGKQVRFKSPATCCGHNGICRYCYGKLFDINKSLFSVGSLAALKSSEPASQGVLSTKHSQDTHSVDLSFSEGFDKIFELDSSEVLLKDDSDLDSALFLQLDEVIEDSVDDTVYYYTKGFKVIDNDGNTIYNIVEENDSKMYLCDQLIHAYKKNKKDLISLEAINDEEALFFIEVKSKELTEPIKVFNKLLNTNEHGGAKNISELCQLYAEALISMGLKYHLVHYETIIRALVRKKSNVLEYPDFTRAGDPNDWTLVRLDYGLQHHPSAMVSLPYGYLRKQLLSTELYKKKSASHLDPLYTRNLAEYLTEE